MRIGSGAPRENRTIGTFGGHRFLCPKCKTFRPHSVELSGNGIPCLTMRCQDCKNETVFERAAGAWVPANVVSVFDDFVEAKMEKVAGRLSMPEPAPEVAKPKEKRFRKLRKRTEARRAPRLAVALLAAVPFPVVVWASLTLKIFYGVGPGIGAGLLPFLAAPAAALGVVALIRWRRKKRAVSPDRHLMEEIEAF